MRIHTLICLTCLGILSLAVPGQAVPAPDPPSNPAAATSATSAASAGLPDTAQSYYHFLKARQALLEGDATEAEKSFKSALTHDPDNAGLILEYARFLLQNQNLQEASLQLQHCLEKHPDTLEAHKILANLYMSTMGETFGDTSPQLQETLQKGIHHFEEALRIDPADADCLFSLGRIYLKIHEYEKSEQYLRRYLQANPNAMDGNYYLTIACMELGKYELALETVQLLQVERPDSLQIRMLKAEILEKLQRFDQAEEIYQHALTLQPNDPDFYANFARLLMQQQKSGRAIEVLEKAKAEGVATADLLSLLGQIYRIGFNYDKAISNLKEAVVQEPGDAEIRYQLAMTHAQMGDTPKAIQLLQTLLKDAGAGAARSGLSARQRRLFMLNLAFLYADDRQFKNAIELLQRFQKEFPGDKEPLVYLQLSQIYRNYRQWDKARAIAEDGLKVMPGHSRLLNERAQALAGAGQWQQAVEDLRREIAAGHPDDISLYTGAAAICSENRQWAAAFEILAQGLAKYPADGALLFQRAAVQEKSGDYAGATATFLQLLEADPDNGTAWNYLGYMLIDFDQDIDRGIEYVQKALRIEPNNPAFLDSLGWGYYKKKDFKKALEYLQRAVAAMDDDPTNYGHLGDTYRSLGQNHEARDQYEKALPLQTEATARERLENKIRELKPKLMKKP